MKLALAFACVATATAATTTNGNTFFGPTDKPICHVGADGRTYVHYASTHAEHGHFKCTHNAAATACTCVDHPNAATHSTCQQFDHTDGTTHTISADGSCPDANAPAAGASIVGQVMEWCGKVNQHKPAGGAWTSDTDGVSGCSALSSHGWWANADNANNRSPLQYCKKFWPDTTHTTSAGMVSHSGWCNAGNTACTQTSTKEAFNCHAPVEVGQVMEWCGKVNQHKAVGGAWTSDADGVTGCSAFSSNGWWADANNANNRSPLQYCKKFWPSTVSAPSAGMVSHSGWCNAGNTACTQTSTKEAFSCKA